MGKVALMFPGQGAQTVGMGKELLELSPAAGDLCRRASEILGYDLLDICLNGPIEKLNSTVVSQPAIFTLSLAALEYFLAERPEIIHDCRAAAGLSLGEYTALVFADAISFEDGVRLVQRRGEAMQAASDAVPGGMVSILGLETEKVEAICDEARGDDILVPANYLCPGNIVLSGATSACQRAAAAAESAGAMKVIPLSVAGAFHTSMMAPAADALRETLDAVEFRPPRIPVISNVDVSPHIEPEDIRNTLLRQLMSPVLWESTIRRLLSEDFDLFCEVGPGRVLRGLMKRIDRKAKTDGAVC